MSLQVALRKMFVLHGGRVLLNISYNGTQIQTCILLYNRPTFTVLYIGVLQMKN